MAGNKALRRVAKDAPNDSIRINANIPLITDKTELITPEAAKEILARNKKNRPISWGKVEEYRRIMERGEWKLHAQGIIIDSNGNLLTGQKRLWAIILSGMPQFMRVSRGSPPDTAEYIDRGAPQTSRDLASRKTDRKHSPTEQSLARAICALNGNAKPSLEEIAATITEYDERLSVATKSLKGIKKTKGVLMVAGTICADAPENVSVQSLLGMVEVASQKLTEAIHPLTPDKCWNRGAAFVFGMSKARKIIKQYLSQNQAVRA